MTVGSAASYVAGQCTAFVATAFTWIPGNLGNANAWYGNAQKAGLPTTSTPTIGSVATWNAGPNTSSFGHVAVVTGIIPGGFSVIEQNFSGGPGVVDNRNVTGSGLQGLQGFILPPGGASGSTSTTSSTGTSTANPNSLFSGIDTSGLFGGVTATLQDIFLSSGFVILGLILVGIGAFIIASPQLKKGTQIAAKGAAV